MQEKLSEGKKTNVAYHQGQSPECLPDNSTKMSGGINARFTPTFNLSILVSKLRGVAQYVPEYDLRDLLNKNQSLARNSRGASFRKNK